jgi:hypothetical protein
VTDQQRITELERLERLADDSQNPVFAWNALALCECPEQLPEWVWDYLRGCAERLALINPDPRSLASAVLDALWLSGKGGPGVFRKAEAARRQSDALEHMAARIPEVGIDKAANEASKLSGYAASTLRGYWYERQRA